MVAKLPPTDPSGKFGPPPVRDMDISDGQKLTLGDTTIQATLADNSTVTLDTAMAARESRHFAATDRFEVAAADSAAVLLALNGRSVPFAGATSSSATIVLTSNDSRQATGGNTQR